MKKNELFEKMEMVKSKKEVIELVKLYFSELGVNKEGDGRKAQVLECLEIGMTTKEIAEKIGIKNGGEGLSELRELVEWGYDVGLEFNYQDKTGFIDLIYFNKEKNGWVIVDFKTGIKSKEKEETYRKQLEFYEEVLNNIGLSVVSKEILWV